MASNDDIAGGDRGSPKDRTAEGLALVYELIEALTAVRNYLAAAKHIFGAEACAVQNTLQEALEKSLAQFERANEAAHLLRDFLHHEAAIDDGGP